MNGKSTRPTLEQTFMTIAQTWSERSTCSSKIKVGCVLVNAHNQIIASGYNGSPRGMPHCDDPLVGCDDDGKSHRVIHAEMNAIIQCAITGVSSKGAKLYCTHCPCLRCAQVLIQAGIKEVIYKDNPLNSSIRLLHKGKISVIRIRE